MPDTTHGLAIVGPGLIGTSVALAAKRRWPELQVRTVDRGDSLSAIGNARVVVLAAPVNVILDTIPMLPRWSSPGRPGDRHRQHQARDHERGERPPGSRSLSAAIRWPAARASPMRSPDLFDGRPWFLTNPDAPDAVLRASRLVEALGARPVVLSDHGEEHDRLMAAVSHLPQVTATMLMTVVARAVGADNLHWAGNGLRDTTRLAVEPGRRCGRACWRATAPS